MNVKIREYLVKELLSGKAIGDQDELLLNGLIDSLGIMRLVTFIEQQCSITIPPQDVTIEHFANISAISAYLKGRVSA